MWSLLLSVIFGMSLFAFIILKSLAISQSRMDMLLLLPVLVFGCLFIDTFYHRNLYTRIRDTFNRPVTDVPGRTIKVLERISINYNEKFEYLK
jgi:hypothetical protein